MHRRDILVDTVPWVLEPLKDGQQGASCFPWPPPFAPESAGTLVTQPHSRRTRSLLGMRGHHVHTREMPNSSPLVCRQATIPPRSSTGELAANWLLSNRNTESGALPDKVKNLMGRLTSSQHFIYLLRAELQVEVLFLR